MSTVDVFITDASIDNLLAWYIYLVRKRNHKTFYKTKKQMIAVVITNIYHVERAYSVMRQICNEVDKDIHISFFHGIKALREQKHESILEIKNDTCTQPLSPILPGIYDNVFMFAPFNYIVDCFAGSKRLYVSMGYALNRSNVMTDDLHNNFTDIITMNNEYSYAEGEKRVRLTILDAFYITRDSTTLRACIQKSVQKSIHLIADEFCKLSNEMSREQIINILSTTHFDEKKRLSTTIRKLQTFSKYLFHQIKGEAIRFNKTGEIDNPTYTFLDKAIEQVCNGITIDTFGAINLVCFYDTSVRLERGSFISSFNNSHIQFVKKTGGNVLCVRGITNAGVLREMGNYAIEQNDDLSDIIEKTQITDTKLSAGPSVCASLDFYHLIDIFNPTYSLYLNKNQT